MKRWLLTAVLLIVAAASVISLFLLSLGNMMVPGWSRHDPMLLLAAAVIAAVTVAALFLAFRKGARAPNAWLITATILAAAVAYVPHAIDAQEKREEQARARARNLAYETSTLAGIET